MTIRAGIIGAGNIFERGYLPALEATDAIRVVAVSDLDDARAASAAARLGGADVAATPAGLLARTDLDAVLILTPTDTHADLSIAALEAGHHVLCEKPMARSSVDARRMAAVAAHAGRRLMVGHARRFDDRWTTMYDQVAAGRIGDPVYLYRSEHAFNGAAADAWQWRDASSGGVLWDVGVHVTEFIHWFFGAIPRTAFAKVLHSRSEAAAGGAPDAAIVTFDFGDARHAVLSVSWMHPPAWGPFYATTDVIGTRGRLEFHDRDAHPTMVVRNGVEIARHSPLLSALAGTFRREIEHFAWAIERDAPFAVGMEDAVIAIDMIAAAEDSVRSGRPEMIAGAPP